MITKIEKNPLKQVIHIEDAIAAAFNHFDLVIQSLDKTAGLAIDKIVQDFLSPLVQGLQEALETAQTTCL